MTDEKNAVVGSFTCPMCTCKLPAWKAVLVTRWTRYTCPQCQSLLSPVMRDVENTGIVLTVLGALGGYLIPTLLYRTYGLWVVLACCLVFLVFGLFVSMFVCNTYVHLELSKIKFYHREAELHLHATTLMKGG